MFWSGVRAGERLGGGVKPCWLMINVKEWAFVEVWA
jgi:hypothetical protein